MAKIKVILTETVAGQGKKGEIINVSEGYAKNFLLKNKKAVLATDDELKKLENKKKKVEKAAEEEKLKAEELKKVLESKTVKMKVKAGANGKVFGSVTSKDIASVIEKELGIQIDKKKNRC